VIHPLPSGTRDVLPDEMRELRAIVAVLQETFARFGYGEVSTPAIEYEEVLVRGGGGPQPAYRVFDDHGEVLALRSDMTVPIARVAATRYATADPPLRFAYVAHVYRAVRPHRGQMREFLQAGIELLGAPAPEGTAEALRVLCAALDAVGLGTARIGLGSAAVYPSLLEAYGVDERARPRLLEALGRRDLVALEEAVRGLALPAAAADALVRVPQLRGGPEVLAHATGPVADSAEGLRRVLALLDDRVAGRIIVDLGLGRGFGYYTGAVFDVYDPALGTPIGGGGRYDDLAGRFGRDLPAVGFALGVDLLHLALAGEGR
jgi:ATP phosphoribosyltransferase regulatory subunit